MNYLQAEHLKNKRTFTRKLIVFAPVITALMSFFAPLWFQLNSYNWWYILLCPGFLTLECALLEQRDNGKLKYRAVFPLPVDLKKVWKAKTGVAGLYVTGGNVLFLALNLLGGYLLVTREHELCVLQYFIGSQFTASWLPDFFPSPDSLMVVLILGNSVLVIAVLTAKFAKMFCSQLHPLMEATQKISGQNLDFEVGDSKIKEFEEVLHSFSSMKDNLKDSLEKQWNAEQLQREQIAALAHDLKTPLTVIQGNIDLISETELDEEQQLYAGYITESSEQIGVYIKTLIDISRTAAGYQLQLEEFDVADYMEQIKAQADSLCLTKEVGLRMETGTESGILQADQLLLERAIMNVIGNALDYSPPEGTIYVTVQKADGFLQISVTDAGSAAPRAGKVFHGK